jgi:hypothetical protein
MSDNSLLTVTIASAIFYRVVDDLMTEIFGANPGMGTLVGMLLLVGIIVYSYDSVGVDDLQ